MTRDPTHHAAQLLAPDGAHLPPDTQVRKSITYFPRDQRQGRAGAPHLHHVVSPKPAGPPRPPGSLCLLHPSERREVAAGSFSVSPLTPCLPSGCAPTSAGAPPPRVSNNPRSAIPGLMLSCPSRRTQPPRGSHARPSTLHTTSCLRTHLGGLGLAVLSAATQFGLVSGEGT